MSSPDNYSDFLTFDGHYPHLPEAGTTKITKDIRRISKSLRMYYIVSTMDLWVMEFLYGKGGVE